MANALASFRKNCGQLQRRGVAALALSFASLNLAQGEDKGASSTGRTMADLLAMEPGKLDQVDIAEMQLVCSPSLKREDIFRGLQMIAAITADAKKQLAASGENTSNPDLTTAIQILRKLKAQTSVPLPFPILCLSVGRQMGFPLKLAAFQGGLGIIWDGSPGRYVINENSFLTSSQVENAPPLAVKIDPSERLHVLNSSDEFSFFLAQRGDYFQSQGSSGEALFCYANAHLVSPDCGDYLKNIAASAARITPFFGHAQPMTMPSYRDSMSEVDLLNMPAKRQQEVDFDYAREINDLQRQQWDDPRARTKALNALQLKYQHLRLETTQQQNQALIQQEMQRQEQRGQPSRP